MSRLGAAQSSVMECVDDATSTWIAKECNRVLARELTEGGEESRGNLVAAAKQRELISRRQFEAFK